jgi:mono/diheme cytochrome c family protein
MRLKILILAPSVIVAAAATSWAAAAGDVTGADLYGKHCIACHQANGEGAPGIAAPISGTLLGLAKTPAGRDFLAQIMVSGMVGTISSHGMRYLGNMPAFNALADGELASVMNHVLLAFNGADLPLPAEAFAAARRRAMPPAEVFKLRQRAQAQSGG